ncbi:MAG TPA: DUF998 domain-containing protein [Microbacterium sp.]|uniref:DUF998 domain-containing protein n=1 Tax=Microbacterium sp. TaxID=51671 RepID=UPI002B477F8E|nr:DUF998 domain-containing protein [Microbacterium sp.]HKT56638.1 DUF998 domain-containing protein [Microbacterium sp.]
MSTISTRAGVRPAVVVAYAGAGLYVVLLLVLHMVQPQMLGDATISKYALGPGGWMLQVAFVAAGVGYAGLALLSKRWVALLAWLTAAAFAVMGAFRIDSVGPTQVVSVHGALHTGAFFAVVMLAHALMFVRRPRAHSSLLRILPFVAPVLAVAGFFLPGLLGAVIFRLWTLSLVVWVVLTAREAS